MTCRRFLSGDEACAEGVRLARPHVVSAYPVTPQTVVVERLSEMVECGDLNVKLLGRGFAWLDTGTMDSLLEASDFVQMIQKRQGIEISAPEEIAFLNGWISKETLLEAAAEYGKSPYGEHLRRVADGKIQY